MVELSVAGLSMDPVSKSPILVLRTISQKHILPIWIGPSEAVSISLALQEIKVPRPLTHDLLLSAVEAVGYQLKSVQLVKVDDGVFYAQLELSKENQTSLVDCRPSDAVALALRAQAPILASKEVMDEAALEYPKDQHQPVAVSAGDGAIAMLAPDHEFDDLDENSDTEMSDILAGMDP